MAVAYPMSSRSKYISRLASHSFRVGIEPISDLSSPLSLPSVPRSSPSLPDASLSTRLSWLLRGSTLDSREPVFSSFRFDRERSTYPLFFFFGPSTSCLLVFLVAFLAIRYSKRTGKSGSNLTCWGLCTSKKPDRDDIVSFFLLTFPCFVFF